jgi:hypothetical protein
MSWKHIFNTFVLVFPFKSLEKEPVVHFLVMKLKVLHSRGSGKCGSTLLAWLLSLPHKQMHYRQGSFFKKLKRKTATKGIKNILPRHHKLKIS